MSCIKKAVKYSEDCGIFAMIQKTPSVVVGFSGGADSSVLLSFFLSLREKFPELNIIAAHLNHLIRGNEAMEDEAFCRSFCAECGITLEVRRADIPALSKETGKGLEEVARDVRYAFFEELSKKYGGALISTAHNADDNLETLLFNIARGSGTKGVTAISPVRDGKYIRPLLSCTSKEIRDFANENGIPFVVDSTNCSTDYTRNSIRHNIIPKLREINPKVCEAALRLSRSAGEDCEYIELEADKIIGGRTVLSRKELRALHPALFSRVLRQMMKAKVKSTNNLSQKNVSDCRRLVEVSEKGSISLPLGCTFVADCDEVYILIADDTVREKDCTKCERVLLEQNKTVELGEFLVFCGDIEDYISLVGKNVYNLSLHTRIDCDRIYGKLSVRCRLPGDKILMGKMNKKLKKLFCDKNVPVRLRNTLPVIEDERGILWVPLVGVRDDCKAEDKTQKAVNIFVYERDKV